MKITKACRGFGEMIGKAERTKKMLEYQRDCLQDCLERDLSHFTNARENILLYYQFITEDLAKIERYLQDIDRVDTVQNHYANA